MTPPTVTLPDDIRVATDELAARIIAEPHATQVLLNVVNRLEAEFREIGTLATGFLRLFDEDAAPDEPKSYPAERH